LTVSDLLPTNEVERHVGLRGVVEKQLIAVAVARGIHFHVTGGGALWFAAAATLFAVGMYAVAETLAGRVPKAEEYIARVPAIETAPGCATSGG
jgi:hypothetical protein